VWRFLRASGRTRKDDISVRHSVGIAVELSQVMCLCLVLGIENIIVIIIIIIICTKLSSKKSRRQGDYTVEPSSANGQTYPQ